MAKRKTTRRRRSRVSGLNSKDFTNIGTSAVIGGAGSVVMKMILDKVLPDEYTQYTSYAQILGGLLLAASVKNSMLQAAGLGAATVGAANVVADLTDGQVSGLGLLPYGKPSTYLAGLNPDSGVKTM